MWKVIVFLLTTTLIAVASNPITDLHEGHPFTLNTCRPCFQNDGRSANDLTLCQLTGLKRDLLQLNHTMHALKERFFSLHHAEEAAEEFSLESNPTSPYELLKLTYQKVQMIQLEFQILGHVGHGRVSFRHHELPGLIQSLLCRIYPVLALGSIDGDGTPPCCRVSLMPEGELTNTDILNGYIHVFNKATVTLRLLLNKTDNLMEQL